MSTPTEVEFDYQTYMKENTPEIYRGPEARRKRREAARARVFPNKTHIVRAADLEQYANSINSQTVIPELIYLLVKQSISHASVCRIPYGDAVNQSGWDGIVEAESAFLEFVPDGRSYWEIGTGNDPQTKATKDFKKRTSQLSADDRAQGSFVFVTPRFAGWGAPEQIRWLERRKDKGWKDIRIIDGVKLADWLREFPAVGQWMAEEIGLSSNSGGISTPREHWENIVSLTKLGDPPIPPTLFTEGRSHACNALQALFEGTSQKLQLLMFAEGKQDVADFVAAYIETLDEDTARDYANRCLYIAEENAWRTVVEVRKSHVLVANPRLNLESDERAGLLTIATRKGHAVIVPLCGAFTGRNPAIIKLQSPSQLQIEKVLKEADYSDVRSRELAGIGGNRLSALLRNLRGLGAVPPYATWENAKLFAQAGLAGKWNGKIPADRKAMENLLGKEYGEWIETLRPDALRSDSPLIQRDEKWRFVVRGEAWSALGNRITDEDLNRLEETAVAVLGERDPEFDLPKEKRFAASIHGKQLKHSRLLREGMAETLALVGSRSEALSECSFRKAEYVAVRTVQRLLASAKWDHWASLDSLLPLLAEAAPNEFLAAVESALVDLDQSPFHEVFAQESSGGIGGGNYMSGLLWALETLAWHPDFLSRVAVILSDLASIDPGGNWANRPFNSLFDIFLPWHVQTSASLEKRKAAIKNVLQEQPEVGWQLIIGLLPHNHGFTIGCHQPTWRDYIPRDWKDGVSRSEYWEQITIYTEMAIELAKTSTENLGELINCMSDLPNSALDNLLEHLASEEVVALPEADRVLIWERLDGLVRQHRKFADAEWAMPKGTISRIETVANTLAPETPVRKYCYLFNNQGFDLFFDDTENYEEQKKRLDKAQRDAVQKILDTGGVSAVLDFAQSVAIPGKVGYALSSIENEEIEVEILPSLLNTEDETANRVVSGFVHGRFQKSSWTWVDQVLGNDWNDTEKNAFLILLPFEDGVWSRVEEHLGRENERLYWQKVAINRFGPDRDLTLAIEKLLEYERAPEAVLCVSRTVNDRERFKEDLAIRALLSVLEKSDVDVQLDQYQTVEVIKCLQKSPSVDREVLCEIEWCFLSMLRFSTGSPVTLESRLASEPAFFAEIVAYAFRSKNEAESDDEPSEERKATAMNAYRLLNEWRGCPGKLSDDAFDKKIFTNWLNEAMRITKETGHSEIAQNRIGHVLTNAPKDPNGLWIHRAVAAALNERDAGKMRSGFTIELYNQRGVHGFTAGREERELAQLNREKAEALETAGYSRFATAMREFARGYERDAERDAQRSPFEE